MTKVNSVLGPLDTTDLGFTLMHEHIMAVSAGTMRYYPEFLGPNPKERIIAGLKKAREGSIDTVVDATTFDGERDVALLREVSRQTDVNIIVASGWTSPDAQIGDWSADRYAELFIREVEEGIAGTGIKAGILKSYADYEGVTPGTERILRAIAMAHLKTGVPIMLHSYAPGQVARQQLRILKEEGVTMNRIKVDHCLDTTDIEYLEWIAGQGCYLGVDRLPGLNVSTKARARTIKALMDAGWTDRLLPSHDHMIVHHMPHMPPQLRAWFTNGNPHGFLYIKKEVFPLLSEMGVDETTLNSLFIDNPRHFFEDV